MKTFIFDTNIILSAIALRSSNEAKLIDLWLEKKFILAITPAILEEYRDVLSRNKFKKYPAFSEVNIENFFSDVEEYANFYPGEHPVSPLTADPSDEIFLSCAVEADADVLVTGDRKHLLPLGSYEKTRIMTTSQALTELNQRVNEPDPIQELVEFAKEKGVSVEELMQKIAEKKKAA